MYISLSSKKKKKKNHRSLQETCQYFISPRISVKPSSPVHVIPAYVFSAFFQRVALPLATFATPSGWHSECVVTRSNMGEGGLPSPANGVLVSLEDCGRTTAIGLPHWGWWQRKWCPTDLGIFVLDLFFCFSILPTVNILQARASTEPTVNSICTACSSKLPVR